MRYVLAAALLLSSSPALATGGFQCRPVSGSGPILNIGIGHGLSLRPFAVSIEEGRRVLSTGPGFVHADRSGEGRLMLGQSWIDGQRLWIDLVDPQGMRFEAKLRATFQPKKKGRPAIGTLVRKGRTYRVRCIEA